MTDKLREAAQLVLCALERVHHTTDADRIAAADALRAALAQQEWIDDAGRLQWALWRIKDLEQQLAGRPVAVTPPAQRVMLTDDEIDHIEQSFDRGWNHIDLARAVIEAYERKNGIK